MLSRIADCFAQHAHYYIDGTTEKKSDECAREHGDERRDDDVDLCLARHERAHLEGCKRGDKRAQRFANHGVDYRNRVVSHYFTCERGEHADYRRRNRHERSFFELVAHAERDTGAHHKLRELADYHDITAERAADKRADFADYRADNERREQSQRHARQSVDKDISEHALCDLLSRKLLLFARLVFFYFHAERIAVAAFRYYQRRIGLRYC